MKLFNLPSCTVHCIVRRRNGRCMKSQTIKIVDLFIFSARQFDHWISCQNNCKRLEFDLNLLTIRIYCNSCWPCYDSTDYLYSIWSQDSFVKITKHTSQIRRQMSLGTYLEYEKSILGWFGQPGQYCEKKSLGRLQSYEIKSPPRTILWFRILGIFSVENIKWLCVFMFQTWDNSQLLRRVLWISAEQG